MRHWKIWLYLIAMIGILAFCVFAGLPAGEMQPFASGAKEVVPEAKPVEPATAVAQVTDIPAEEVIEAPAEAPTDAPTEAPTQTVAVAAEQVDYCMDCHTDKDQLIDTAAPEEEVVEESEGAG